MENIIKVLSIRRGETPCVTHINNTLEAMQKFVGGYIETLTLTDKVVLVCNEEGKIRQLPPSCMVWRGNYNEVIAGDCFLCGIDGDEFADFPTGTDLNIEKITHIELPAIRIGG